MIEINLLRPRIKPPGWQTPLEPRGRSAFISRRELVLAIVLLALGFSVLRLGFGLFDLETNMMGDHVSSGPPNPPPSGDLPRRHAVTHGTLGRSPRSGEGRRNGRRSYRGLPSRRTPPRAVISLNTGGLSSGACNLTTRCTER